MCISRVSRRWTTTRPTGRWTCWLRPTPRRRCRRRSSSPAPTCLNLEVDLLFFDTTSTYFERDEPEQGPARAPFRVLGHSKDHRPDLPQVVIGLAVTREGIPVRVWVWPGNTNDQTVVAQVKDDLARLAARPADLGRRPRLLQRRQPPLPDPRRRALDRRRADARRLRRREGGALPSGPLPARARQPARQGGHASTTARASGSSSATTRPRPNATKPNGRRSSTGSAPRSTGWQRRDEGKRANAAGAHTKAECELRDHPTLSRYLRQTAPAAPDRPGQGRRRRAARRQVPDLHQRPAHHRRRRRARLQEPAPKPNAPSATSRAPSAAAGLSTGSSTASAPTSSSAGSRCCSSGSPNAASP